MLEFPHRNMAFTIIPEENKSMKIWVNKAKNFEAVELFDKNYYLKMSSKQRLETVQILREMWFKSNKNNNENGKRLRRIVRVIKQK